MGGLQPDREYTFSLSALTRQGPGQDTSITMRTGPNCELHRSQETHPQRVNGHGRPEQPRPHLLSPPPDSTHLAAVLTPVVLLLCCTVLLWPRRKA